MNFKFFLLLQITSLDSYLLKKTNCYHLIDKRTLTLLTSDTDMTTDILRVNQ